MKIFVHVNGGEQDFYMDADAIPYLDSTFEHNGFLYRAGNYFLDSAGDFFKKDTLLGCQKHCIYAKIIKIEKAKPESKRAIGFAIEPMMISNLINQLTDFKDSYGDVEIDGIKSFENDNNHNFMFRVSMNYGATTINIFKPKKDGV